MVADIREGIRRKNEAGLTLVELLVAMVVAMVVLAGLLLTFTQQYGEYKHQSKRVDAVQDLEFAITFVADDLRSALHGMGLDPVETNGFGSRTAATGDLRFWVWETNAAYSPDANQRARRRYHYDAANETLCYDRQVAVGADDTVTASGSCQVDSEVLRNVTFFKVFQDSTTPRDAFGDIPAALPSLNIRNVSDPINRSMSVPAYTILIEVAVDAGYKKGSFVDVLGNDQRPGVGDGRKRVWRYVQVQPQVAL